MGIGVIWRDFGVGTPIMDQKDRIKLEALKEACRTDLKFLCKDVLGMKDWQDSLHGDNPPTYDVDKTTKRRVQVDPGGLAWQLKQPDKEKGIFLARGHLKSSLVTVGYVIQQILINPNIRVLITNAVLDRSKEFLQQIQDYLTTQSQLPIIFGEFRHKDISWTSAQCTIVQKNDPTKRGPTIRIAGLETSLTGSHCDLIIHDDLVELNNVQTKDQIKKVIQFFNASYDILDPGGDMIVVGTRWAEDDLYGLILKEHTYKVNSQELAKDKLWRDYVIL